MAVLAQECATLRRRLALRVSDFTLPLDHAGTTSLFAYERAAGCSAFNGCSCVDVCCMGRIRALVRYRHMPGLFAQSICPPALMGSADQVLYRFADNNVSWTFDGVSRPRSEISPSSRGSRVSDVSFLRSHRMKSTAFGSCQDSADDPCRPVVRGNRCKPWGRDSRRFRAPCIMDGFSREYLAILVDNSIPGTRVECTEPRSTQVMDRADLRESSLETAKFPEALSHVSINEHRDAVGTAGRIDHCKGLISTARDRWQ